MKRSCLIILLATLVVSCGKEIAESMTATELRVEIPGQTKAGIVDGTGKNVTRFILEAYAIDGPDIIQPELHRRIVQENLPAGTLQTSFSLILRPSTTYEILVWADSGSSWYEASSLLSVRDLKLSECNDDASDAFCAADTLCLLKGRIPANITLRRPLGQINIITTDAAANDIPSETKPVAVAAGIKSVPEYYNVSTGMTFGNRDIDIPFTAVYDEPGTEGHQTIFMKYIFADADGGVFDFSSVRIKTDNEKIYELPDLTNIPEKRNYRTNISGGFIHSTGDFSIVVDPEWSGEIDN